jgi:hypothetical protein
VHKIVFVAQPHPRGTAAIGSYPHLLIVVWFDASGAPFQTSTSVNYRNLSPTKTASNIVVSRPQSSNCPIIIYGYHLFVVALRWLGFVT